MFIISAECGCQILVSKPCNGDRISYILTNFTLNISAFSSKHFTKRTTLSWTNYVIREHTRWYWHICDWPISVNNIRKPLIVILLTHTRRPKMHAHAQAGPIHMHYVQTDVVVRVQPRDLAPCAVSGSMPCSRAPRQCPVGTSVATSPYSHRVIHAGLEPTTFQFPSQASHELLPPRQNKQKRKTTISAKGKFSEKSLLLLQDLLCRSVKSEMYSWFQRLNVFMILILKWLFPPVSPRLPIRRCWTSSSVSMKETATSSSLLSWSPPSSSDTMLGKSSTESRWDAALVFQKNELCTWC